MIKNFGKFDQYDLPEDHPEKFLQTRMNAKFWRNEQGQDWYQLVRENTLEDVTWATVTDEGLLHSVENEMDRIVPNNFTVVAFDRY